MEVGQASLVVSSEASTTALNEFETTDLNKKVQVLGRACDTNVMRENSSEFPQVETALALVNIMADNFHGYNVVVETISLSHLGEGGSSDVTDSQMHVKFCDLLSVFRTSVKNVLSWLDFLLVLMFGITKRFC